MVLELPESGSGQKRSPSVAGSGPRETLQRRLREAGLDVERFVDLIDGTKASYRDHNDPRFQFEETELSGSYGVLAGDGLVIFDIDDWETVPEWLEALPDTYTVQSPHGGEHRYYVVSGAVSNAGPEWGEVQAEGVYVVGPRSELTDCDYGCCSSDSRGRYEIGHDRPIASISAEALPVQSEADTSAVGQVEIPEQGEQPAELDFSDIEAPFDVQQKWEMLLNSEKGETYRHITAGEFREAGYVADDGTGDGSEAEMALCEGLGWAMDDEKEVVAEVMGRICRANPNTDRGGEYGWKWIENPGNYRQQTLEKACDHPRTHEEASNWPTLCGEERPEVSGPTEEQVYDALLDLKVATTSEVLDHERVDITSQRQARRALDRLIDSELADWIRDGNDCFYYPTLYEDYLEELL